MSSGIHDDGDYPYAPQTPAILGAHVSAAPPPTRRSFRAIFVWLGRLALLALVGVLIVLVPGGFIAYRARQQAALIGQLEALDCEVTYVRDPDKQGQLAEWLSDWFGDEYFGEVEAVFTGNYPAGRRAPLTAEGTRLVCEACRGFGNLRVFRISSNSFQFDQIASWPQLDRLEVLDIDSPLVTDADLARIGKMPRLAQLDLTCPRVTDSGFQALLDLTQLESLAIRSAKVKGTDLRAGSGFPQLTRLTLTNSPQLGDEAILALGSLPNLEDADLAGTNVGDAGVAHLASGGKLRFLCLPDAAITDEGLRPLRNCPDLYFLILKGTAVTNEGLSGLAGTSLSILDLDKTSITDEGLQHLAALRSLSSLSLCDTKFTGVGVRYLTGNPLSSLNVAGAALTPDGIAALAAANISDLNLAKTAVTDQELLLFAANGVLTHLDVTETKVTAAGVRAFYESRKRRLPAAGEEEMLSLISDFPDIAESFLSAPATRIPEAGAPDASPPP
jgi:hypothetical protein